MKRIKNLRWSMATILLGVVCGCGPAGEPSGSVGGKVTLEGEPIPAGVVTYTSSSGFSATGEIGADGSYTIHENVPVGTYTVFVLPPQITQAPGAEGATAKLPDSPIPEGYQTNTDIVVEVSEGENDIPIELKAGGPDVKPVQRAP